MEDISRCRYPSTTMMDRVEKAIRDEESAARYVELLIDHIESDDYPSPMLLDRVSDLIDQLDEA
jgi:hypothetical protein